MKDLSLQVDELLARADHEPDGAIRATVALAAALLVERFGHSDDEVALAVARRIFDDYLCRAIRGQSQVC